MKLLSLILAAWPGSISLSGAGDITAVLRSAREKHGLPAVAGAVIDRGALIAVDAVGVRKNGTEVKVTAQDTFHLGSCTKAMTATVIAMLIERGTLRWETTVEDAFPHMKTHPAYRRVTVRHLLMHRAGLRRESWPAGKTARDMYTLPGSPREQRRAYIEMILNQAPAAKIGERYVYANSGYSVAAAMAEKAMNTPWERFMRTMLFEPLGMKTAGFGAMGEPGKIDQPWQHKKTAAGVIAIEPGRFSDNPPVIGPGGTVHCSMADWATFIQLHLGTVRGGTKLCAKATLRELHEPKFGGSYACGWAVKERTWGGGKVLTHNGTNTMNYAVAWVAPLRQYAVLVATNQGGGNEGTACHDAAAALIRAYPPQRSQGTEVIDAERSADNE